MKPFQLPEWRKRQLNSLYRRKDQIITHATQQMDAVMRQAVESIWEHYERTGQYAEPSLNKMYLVGEHFYRTVVTEAYYSSKQEKTQQKGHKRLAAPWPIGLPRKLVDLEKIFRDRRYWPKIMKRNKAIVDRVRKSYLAKLQRKFRTVVPRLQAGIITPVEAKKQMLEAWEASKSRVELIFRTETATYYGKTQVNFFNSDPDIIGFLFDSVKDVARTEICRSRHGLIFRPRTKLLEENTPACHYNCRSHLIPLANTPYNRKLLDDPSRDPANHKLAPLPHGWRKR